LADGLLSASARGMRRVSVPGTDHANLCCSRCICHYGHSFFWSWGRQDGYLLGLCCPKLRVCLWGMRRYNPRLAFNGYCLKQMLRGEESVCAGRFVLSYVCVFMLLLLLLHQ